MGKTLIFSDVNYAANAIPASEILSDVSYTNAELKAMVTAATTGKYVNDTGVIRTNSSLSYVVIDVKRYSRIIISGYSGTTTGAFLSSASPSSEAFVSAVTRQTDGNLSNESINIPAGATHFAFNLWNTYSNYAFKKTTQ